MGLLSELRKLISQNLATPPTPAPVTASPKRTDQWLNLATGFGDPNRDKVFQGSYAAATRLGDQELSELFSSNDIAARIVRARPEEALRRGYDLEIEDAEDMEKELAAFARTEMHVDEAILEGWTMGRQYGGALVICGWDDGLDPSLPLAEDRIRKLDYLNVVDRRFAVVSQYYTDPLKPFFGKPELYQLNTAMGAPTTYVHESRVFRFDGQTVDILKRRELAGWTYSVLQRPYDTMRGFEAGFQSVANLLTDASQGVFKLQGLMNILASGGMADLQTRMALVDMTRSAARCLVLDAESEDFTRVATSFTGIPEILDRMMMRLASAAEMPVTVLFGRSPAGQNATGESDFRYWYDTISTERTKVLLPILQRFYRLLSRCQNAPTKGKELEVDISFPPLWEPSDLEQAQIRYTMAQADSIYLTQGVVLPEEVALSRWRNGGFNLDMVINEEVREKNLQDETRFEPMPNVDPSNMNNPEEPIQPVPVGPGPEGSNGFQSP